MTTTLQHTDWEVSTAHKDQIIKEWPHGVSFRLPELRKVIPGFTGRRFTKDLKSGTWMKPLGSRPGRTYSSVRDVSRSTLVAIVSGSTTSQADAATDYERVRDMIRELFHDRRGTGLDGELYSRVGFVDYDLDDSIERSHDIDLFKIESWFREDRSYDVC